jgi:Protein of unknown function (DUF2909)
VDSGFKLVVVVLLGCIVVSLGKAMFHMGSGPEQSAKTVQALSWRIGMSLALFALLMAGYYLHLISPNGAR